MFSSTFLCIAVKLDRVSKMCVLNKQTFLPETWRFQVTKASLSEPAMQTPRAVISVSNLFKNL